MIGKLLIVCALAAPAAAEHVHPHEHADGHQVAASLSLMAAQYETTAYGGEYQGAIPSVAWSYGRYAAMANIGLYRLVENGRSFAGLGDTMVGGSAIIAGDHEASVGAMAMVMAPSGEHLLGMGHLMAMPSVFGKYHLHPVLLAASVGYARALGSGAMDHAGHGGMPLVDPMNMSELAWSAGSDVAIGEKLTAGARLSGAVPVLENGVTRVVGGVRAGWGDRKLSTAVEVQAGLVGDPFTVRGVLETSVSF